MKQGRIIKTEHAQFVQAEWSGKNTSGWEPFGPTVLILPDKASETVGNHGLIHVPDDIVERNSLASETGTIVAMGDGAFTVGTNGLPFAGKVKPKPGDKVIFARYSGRIFKGHDGELYRVMTDDCVAAIEVEAPADITENLAASGITMAGSVPAVPAKAKKAGGRVAKD